MRSINHCLCGLALVAGLLGCSRSPHETAAAGDSTSARGAQLPPAASAGDAAAPGAASPRFLRAYAAPVRAAGKGFAHAPDRGDLVEYPSPSQASSRRIGAYTYRRVELSEAHALAAIGRGTLQFTTASGQRLEFVFERLVEHASGDWTWIGRLSGGAPYQQAVLTFGDNAVFGRIAQPDKPPLEVTMKDGQSWLVETDPELLKRFPPAAPRDPDFIPSPAALAGAAAGVAGQNRLAAPDAAATAGNGGAAVVDLLIGYTPGFAADNGGDSGALTRLNHLVEIGNQAYANSQINAILRLVRAMPVNYPDNNSNNTALEELTGFRAPSSRVPPAPAFDQLRAARDQYGADLVSLVRKFNTPENGGCGLAWINGGGQRGVKVGDEFFGYSVVGDGEEASGNTRTFCPDTSLVHELGHNMGSQHDRETATSGGSLSYGAYAYSFGYRSGNFYTVMAYGAAGQQRALIFSNPRSTFCGAPCGAFDTADNARSLSQTIPVVAQFRAAAAPLPPTRTWLISPTSDFNGDGRSDLVYADGAGAVQLRLKTSDERFSRRDIGPYPQGWSLVASGDFDADGIDDLVWQNDASGEIHLWLLNGSGVRQFVAVGTPPPGFRVRAVGDLNGDGRDDLALSDDIAARVWLRNANDMGFTSQSLQHPQNWTLIGAAQMDGDGKAGLLWRNYADGAVDYWRMDGARVVATSNAVSVSPDYTLRGIADLNADGLSDQIWTGNGEIRRWLRQAGSNAASAPVAIGGTPPGWILAGVADIDADRVGELFWRDPNSDTIDYWKLNAGGVASMTRTRTVDFASTPRLIGRFDGDARADVLWSTPLELRLMRKNAQDARYSEGAVLSGYPGGWQLVGAGDFDRDGRDDAAWFNPASGELDYWLIDGGLRRYVLGGFGAAGFVPEAIGDLNGDGRADIVWSDRASQLRIWLKNANGDGFSETALALYPAGWRIAGAGDFNGDGRADLLWLQTGTGVMHYWTMNGAAVQGFFEGGQLPAGHSVRGLGDLDGDGRTDMISSDGAQVLAWTRAAGTAFQTRVLSGVPGGWNLVGVGDANADGRADLFWHQPATGALHYWTVGSGFALNYVAGGYMP